MNKLIAMAVAFDFRTELIRMTLSSLNPKAEELAQIFVTVSMSMRSNSKLTFHIGYTTSVTFPVHLLGPVNSNTSYPSHSHLYSTISISPVYATIPYPVFMLDSVGRIYQLATSDLLSLTQGQG